MKDMYAILNTRQGGMKWYRSLSINQRINAKGCFVLACGISWEDLAFMLTMRERIEVIYKKLVSEGILNP